MAAVIRTPSSPNGATSSSSPTRPTEDSFNGTPLELTDRSPRAVFGDYISVYDIQRAGEDGANVPVYHESRFLKLNLDEIGSATLAIADMAALVWIVKQR